MKLIPNKTKQHKYFQQYIGRRISQATRLPAYSNSSANSSTTAYQTELLHEYSITQQTKAINHIYNIYLKTRLRNLKIDWSTSGFGWLWSFGEHALAACQKTYHWVITTHPSHPGVLKAKFCIPIQVKLYQDLELLQQRSCRIFIATYEQVWWHWLIGKCRCGFSVVKGKGGP